MSELDTDALRIGTWVVDTAISLWLDHPAMTVARHSRVGGASSIAYADGAG